ncbi:MAG: APC family permease, partial [Pirellulaceae bacterium]|nr:APC family permease [Pirellulaceae bacterium]
MHGSASHSEKPSLERGLGPWQATALNIANMVGIGPFITIPAFIATMNGPQAMIGWIAAAVLVLCDGLVWSELGAAMPGSGGTYHFLREIFGRYRWGRIMPFLFIWQFLVSGALEMASGYVGALLYLEYAFPGLAKFASDHAVPGGTRWIAAGSVLLVTVLLCRRITSIGWMGLVLCTGTLITVAIVILAGLANFNPSLLRPPPGAFVLDQKFATGLGGAMLIAIYDYLGYYNICHLGDEVRQPERTIPRAVITSVIVVALLYLTMNVSIIAVVPWQEAMNSKNIAALFMERLYGRPTAVVFTGFILWTSIACMFAATLGYSRIPYAAAKRGDFFPAFAYLHPTGHYPLVSLLVFGFLTAAFCFLDLGTIISAAVCVRIGVQFIGQIIALHLLRTTRPDVKLPFRMWLYPLPSFIALGGWLYVRATADRFVLLISVLVLVAGILV